MDEGVFYQACYVFFPVVYILPWGFSEGREGENGV